MAMNTKDRATLKALRRRLEKRVSLRRLLLFGSRARGDADADSDLDVLVVLEDGSGAEARAAVSECAWETSLQEGAHIVPVVYTRDEWEDGPERSSLLALAVAAEGIPV